MFFDHSRGSEAPSPKLQRWTTKHLIYIHVCIYIYIYFPISLSRSLHTSIHVSMPMACIMIYNHPATIQCQDMPGGLHRFGFFPSLVQDGAGRIRTRKTTESMMKHQIKSENEVWWQIGWKRHIHKSKNSSIMDQVRKPFRILTSNKQPPIPKK